MLFTVKRNFTDTYIVPQNFSVVYIPFVENLDHHNPFSGYCTHLIQDFSLYFQIETAFYSDSQHKIYSKVNFCLL